MAALTSSPVAEICVVSIVSSGCCSSNFLTLGHVDLGYCPSLQCEYFCRSRRWYQISTYSGLAGILTNDQKREDQGHKARKDQVITFSEIG